MGGLGAVRQIMKRDFWIAQGCHAVLQVVCCHLETIPVRLPAKWYLHRERVSHLLVNTM